MAQTDKKQENRDDEELMNAQEFGLILLEQGQVQQVLAKYLNLLMNYQYGMAIMVAPNVAKASSLLNENGE